MAHNTVEPLGTDTSRLRTVFNVPTKLSYVLKKPSIIRTTDTKSRPQRVNSYKLNLFIADAAVFRWFPNPDQVNLHRVNPVFWLMSYARWYKAQSLYTKQRFAKGVQRNITDFLKASITTDSIKIFSITFCTLVTVYFTCKIAKDAFRIVLYVTTFYMQHCAVARFVLNQ